VDDAGHVDADPARARRAQAAEDTNELRLGVDVVEGAAVHRRRRDTDQHLVVDGTRLLDILDADNVGRTVAIPDSSSHDDSSLGGRGPPPIHAPGAGPATA